MKITTKSHPQLVKLAKYAYPDYTGRKFFLEFKKSVNVGDDANWSGGTRCYYRFVRLRDGAQLGVPDFAPWARPENETADLPAGCACVTHYFFCGNDCGLTVILPELEKINYQQ